MCVLPPKHTSKLKSLERGIWSEQAEVSELYVRDCFYCSLHAPRGDLNASQRATQIAEKHSWKKMEA